MNNIQKLLREVKNELHSNDAKGLYIPIMRGMRPLANVRNETKDIYVERSTKDYFKDMSPNPDNIFAGYNMYEEIENLLLGDINKRELIREYEFFLSKYFFHKQITIIPQRGKDVLLVKVGDEEERLIHDLGDGVQSIILLTFPIFIRKNKPFIFYIEEPETHLHPSLQRKLLSFLAKNFKLHQYFFSTHSNHFLEAITEYEDVSLYSFKKSFVQNEFHIQQLTSIKTDILDNLGVRNSSVLMANCTIWVEGITDRLYIQKFLEVYTDKRTKDSSHDFALFKEDHHYAFIEYAGSNIVHWSFSDDLDGNLNASYVSNNILVIADSDYKNGKIPDAKNNRFNQLKKTLKKNFYLIDGKEIENILSKEIICKVVADYESIEVDDIKITSTKAGYNKKNIGEWINKNVKPINRNYQHGNTISDKLNFCRKSIKYIQSVDDLTMKQKYFVKKYIVLLKIIIKNILKNEAIVLVDIKYI